MNEHRTTFCCCCYLPLFKIIVVDLPTCHTQEILNYNDLFHFLKKLLILLCLVSSFCLVIFPL